MSLLTSLLPKKGVKDHFLILGVEEHRIFAACAVISADETKLLGTGESEFSEETQETDATDIAISTAEKNLPENILIEKVIFGLPVAFLENDKIKPEHLGKLKKICKDLSLTPYGFIEYPQALAYFLEKEEESPPTLLLISIGRTYLTFSLVRIGKMENNVVVHKSSSFTQDFESALKHFKSEILPSRIILYDETHRNEQIEAIREELSTYPWHKHTSFLHTPKIEAIPSSTLITALVETAGGNMLKDLQIEEKALVSPTKQPQAEIPPEEKEKQEAFPYIFGFIKNKDISKQIEHIHIYQKETTIASEAAKTPESEEEISEGEFSLKDKLRTFLSNRLMLFFTIGGVLLAISALGFAGFWFYPKAAVNLVVYPVVSSEDVDVVFTTDATQAESTKKTILAKSLSEEVSGEKTASVSGKKMVGEAARGEIVIYNKTTNSKTFSKGTIFISDKLSFTLDNEAAIASASDTGEGLTFGKIVAKITALEIGPDSNIASGTTLSFKDFPQSSYYAKTSQNLTGGTSREVASISKEDQDRLLSLLSDELTVKAKQNIIGKLTPSEKLLEKSIEKNVTNKKFNKEVGMEGKDLKLTATVKISALSFKEEDLTILAKEGSSNPPPAGYFLQKDRSQIRIGETTVDKKGNILARSTIGNFYLPQIDTEKIKLAISGKSYQETAKAISANKEIGAVEIVREADILLFSEMLPVNKANITVKVVAR